MVPQRVVSSIPKYHALLQDVTVTKELPAAPFGFPHLVSILLSKGSAPGILQREAGMKQSHCSWVGFVCSFIWLAFKKDLSIHRMNSLLEIMKCKKITSLL